ncbi:hypothetical protein PoB_003273100 [Plakobranchus ocellatus]|uniref:Amidase domain-containing protein n=1 Tax=Plakobranchus ocellatus TaxID=259542 RepID=A0AAV4AHZ0_9GAST|nr:hypothetical protein PoB_003273100 [Plakobranchus ocellatus]
MGTAVCMRAKTIDFAAVPSPLILVTNSIAKPGLCRTCLGIEETFVSQVRAPTPAPWLVREILKIGSIQVMCLWCKDFAGNRKANSRFTKSTRFGIPLWCKDFAEHGNANSRLTKSARFGEPTLYPAFTLSDYRICDSRHSLSALRSLISAAISISTVNQVIRPR